MAYESSGLLIGRGGVYDPTTSNNVAFHTYKSSVDLQATIIAANYFPPFLGASNDALFPGDVVSILDADEVLLEYQISLIDQETGDVTLVLSSSANGDVVGPGTSTANAIAKYADTSGRLIANTGVTIDNSNNLLLPAAIDTQKSSVLPIGTANALAIEMGAASVPVFVQGGMLIGNSGSGDLTVNGKISAQQFIFPFGTTTISMTLAGNTNYFANGASRLDLVLPATAPVGTIINIYGIGPGLYSVFPNAGQTIYMGISSSTVSVDTNQQYDCMELTCFVADTKWLITSARGGNFTFN